MNARFIIICDKQLLTLRIYRHIIFYTTDVCIIKSIIKPFKKIVKHLDSYWIPVANAHLKTLYHSKMHNIKYFSEYWWWWYDDWFALLKIYIFKVKIKNKFLIFTLNLGFVITYLKDSYGTKCKSFYANNQGQWLYTNAYVGSINYYQHTTLHTPILGIYNSPLEQIPITENIDLEIWKLRRVLNNVFAYW